MVAAVWPRRLSRIQAAGRCRHQAISAVTPAFQATFCPMLRSRRPLSSSSVFIGVGCDTAARRGAVTAADCIQLKARGTLPRAFNIKQSARRAKRRINSLTADEKTLCRSNRGQKIMRTPWDGSSHCSYVVQCTRYFVVLWTPYKFCCLHRKKTPEIRCLFHAFAR